jgi:hypothetical protein
MMIMKGTTIATAFVVVFLLASALAPTIVADIFDESGRLIASGPNIVFPVNTTYSSRIMTLNISLSTKLFSSIPLSATYSLDETPNVTVPLVTNPSMIWSKNRVEGSLTLPDLSDGSHKISVYAEAKWGNGSSYWDSETVYFTVQTTMPSPSSTASPSPSPSPSSSIIPTLQPTINTGAEPPNADSYVTTAFVAVILLVVLSGVALLVYYKKRKHAVLPVILN